MVGHASQNTVDACAPGRSKRPGPAPVTDVKVVSERCPVSCTLTE